MRRKLRIDKKKLEVCSNYIQLTNTLKLGMQYAVI